MNNSMNLLIKNLKEDKIDSIRWGQINDPRRVSTAFKSPAEIAEEKNLTMVAKHDVNLAKMREGEEVDPGQYSVHPKFEKKKAERQREEQEQRKCEAAQKREKANSKAVKEAADEVEVPSLPKGLGRTILKSIWGGDFNNLIKRCSNWHSTAEAIFSNDLVDVFPLVNADLSRFLFNMHYQVPRALPLLVIGKTLEIWVLTSRIAFRSFPMTFMSSTWTSRKSPLPPLMNTHGSYADTRYPQPIKVCRNF
jgi:hypothetical protein